MNEFRAISGDLIQLDPFPKKDERRYATRVIGMIGSQSLLVTVPVNKGNYIIVRPDQMFTARMMHSNEIVGFQTQVLKVLSSPSPYMHLRVPTEFEARQVRQSRRCQVEQAVMIRPNNSDKKKALLDDISVDGARIISHHDLGQKGEAVRVYLSLKLFGRQFDLTVVTTIRRHNLNRDGLNEYGTSFTDLPDQSLLILGGWVNEMLLQQVYD